MSEFSTYLRGRLSIILRATIIDLIAEDDAAVLQRVVLHRVVWRFQFHSFISYLSDQRKLYLADYF